MPNGGYPHQPGESGEPGENRQPPQYDWLYDESGRPRRTGQRTRAGGPGPTGRGNGPGGPNDPTQAMSTPSGGPPRGYPPPGGYRPAGPPPHGQQGGQPHYDQQGGYPQAGYPQQGGYPPGQPPGGFDRGPGPGQRPPGGPGEPLLPRLPHRRGRRSHPLRWILVLLLAYVVFLIAVPFMAWGRVDKVPFEPAGARAADGSGTNYLLVGSDSREGLTPQDRNRLGTGSASGQRTDTIMLLHVPSAGGPPTLVSLPRDSFVPIPGHDRNKINAAFAFGGPKLLAQTVENVTGLRVDGYVEIGFGGFVQVVDGLGGVQMCLDKPVKDEKAHVDLQAGCQVLDGPKGLGFVRARHFDPKGDLGRVERQRQFLSAVMKETLTASTILNPIRYPRVAFAYGDALTVGDSTGIVDTARFALAMRAVSSGKGITLTVPIADPGASTSAGSAVLWDRQKALALFHALRDGQPVPPSLMPTDQPKQGK